MFRRLSKSIILAILAPLFAGSLAHGEPKRSLKKGVGFSNESGVLDRLAPSVDKLGCSWYYNWDSSPVSARFPIKAEYVPMIWGATNCSTRELNKIRRGGHKALLGFNEPDRENQSHVSVRQALGLWPRLVKTGLRLGSPAPADSRKWLPEFMGYAQTLGYRVDFICLHWYGDITDPKAVDNLRQFLTENWRRYHKPIWLTEFSGSTGDWLKLRFPPLTAEKNAEFIRKALPMLESLPFVERYAWFELRWDEEPWSHVALVYPKTGRLTVCGKEYQAGLKR